MNTNENYRLQKRQKWYRYSSLVLCFLVLLTLLPIPVFAEESKDHVIRVGSFEGTYNRVNENGERSGYGYEYLQNIAGYAGWTYEYVTSTWADCFTQLENGEIDVLGGISYTDERAERMLFSDVPMGDEKYYIYTDATNTELSAANLNSFNGKKIGVLLDHTPETVLQEWESRYRVRMQHINISTTEEILEKLASHEIDCFVSVEEAYWAEYDISPITNIGRSDIYFVINKNRPDIKEAIDSAMRRIQDDNPFYTDDLYRKYLSTQSSTFLSREEKDWLAQHGAIRIGYLNEDTGVSVINPSTGELAGVITDYVTMAENCLQGQTLKFELKGYDTRNAQLDALHEEEIDLIFHVSQNPYFAETNQFVLSDTVWVFNLAATTARDTFNENNRNLVAVSKDNFALKAYLSYNYPNWRMVEYDTQAEAVKAVEKGEADCFVSNSGTASEYLKNQKFHSIFLTKPGNVSFAVRQGNPELLSILNKTLMTMPTEQLSGAVISYSTSLKKVTVWDFIQDNFMAVSISTTVFLLLVLFVNLCFLRKSRKAEAKARQSALQEMELNQKLEEKQQELQEALVEAQSANKAKTTFLNNMSHDIRTPINGIIGMLAILEKSEDDPEKIKDCLNKIKVSSHLLLSLINDVLDMAKLESGTVILTDESIDLDQTCEEVTETVRFQAEEAGITVTGEHDDYRGVRVFCSALHLKKVLMNLFTNSIKYNKPGGSIHVTMKTLERTEDQLVCEFKITDTGIGMSEDFVKNKLFVPFVQAETSPRTKYMGTGLGMPIVKGIVEKMGGSITVESKLNEGSCFTVVLPFKLDNSEMSVDKGGNLTADITGLHLLLAEDNELNSEIAQALLEEAGAKTTLVTDGKQAADLFGSSPAGTFDAILMDVMMPVMDGLTATRTIRAMDHPDAGTIPIIAMTANVFKEDVDQCMEAGMNGHLAKPLDIDKVKQVICEEVRGRAMHHS